MSKLTLNSSQEDIFQYLGLDENKEAYLWYMEKKKDLDTVIRYCELRNLDFCLEDDFDIYFSDSFERVGNNNYFGFTIMKEKTTYEYFVTIEKRYGCINNTIGQCRDTSDSLSDAMSFAKRLYVDTNHAVVIITHKINANGEVIDIKSELINRG